MFNIYDSNVKVTNLKVVSDKMVVGTCYSTHKEGKEFIKTFIECKIVGNALTKFNELSLKNQDRMNIIQGVIRNEPFKTKEGKEYNKNVITIFELKEYEKPIQE